MEGRVRELAELGRKAEEAERRRRREEQERESAMLQLPVRAVVGELMVCLVRAGYEQSTKRGTSSLLNNGQIRPWRRF